MRFASGNITQLNQDEVFVYGSNLLGHHSGGAAKLAMKWGAKWNKGVGLSGQTYAIPTKKDFRTTLPVDDIRIYVDQFIYFAKVHPELIFLVTKIGTGLAGIPIEKIAPLFEAAKDIPNIVLPKEFYQ